jgi:phosphate transport system substrate-binding protein
VGVGGKGNEGVAGLVRQLPGALGYVELIYALQNKINYGSVKNSSGQFIKASLDSTTAAAAGVKMPADFRVSITNPPGKTAYPIASFTWLLIPTNPTDKTKGKMVKAMVLWALDNGEGMAAGLSYAPLPGEVVAKVKAAVNQQVK